MAKIKGFLGLRAESKAEIADDGQVATLGFSNLEVKVGDQNPTPGATRVESFTLQLSENTTELPIRLVAQGYVFTAPGTRAILVAHMGEITTLTSFPPQVSARVFEQEVLQELKATIPAGVDVQITLFLLAERYSSDAYLNIATLDFSLEV
ncbi:MAG TPA: hypothetical protein VGF67_12200 [Ktedonobacteraceae bacterium]|jgi:hypothetical protein